MELLQQFYNNKALRLEVEKFLQDTVRQNALDKLFKGQDATAAAEAKKVVDKAFSSLREMFEPIKRNNKKSSR